jgi:23S rRNA pseudouridine1911/1915/1917 synthase
MEKENKHMKNIIFEDRDIIVVEKEAGIPVQSARIGTKDMVSILKNYLVNQTADGKEPYVGVIHRLDQPVEGILVFAKTPVAAKELSKQIANQKMKKKYLAVVCGENLVQEEVLEDYLVKDGRNNLSRVVLSKEKGAKLAKLFYRVKKTMDETSLIEIDLFTGRHHQIRVQMAHHKMPLLGDRKYSTSLRVSHSSDSLALCAYSLEFTHPMTGKIVQYEIQPKGKEFQKFL